MSVSGRGDSMSQDPHAAMDSSGQNRQLKDRGVVQGAAANNFSFFNLNAIH